MNLNIGCNHYPVAGYVNIDIVPFPGVTDVVGDAMRLPFKPNSIESIYAGHLIEHLRNPVAFVMECRRVLQPRGTLSIVIPDMVALHDLEIDRKVKIGILFGFWPKDDGTPDPDVPEAMHKTWWNRDLLRDFVTSFGFEAQDVIPGGTIEQKGDERQVIGATWQSGIIFRKVRLGQGMRMAFKHYCRILGAYAKDPK